jgi:hypothetical protein
MLSGEEVKEGLLKFRINGDFSEVTAEGRIQLLLKKELRELLGSILSIRLSVKEIGMYFLSTSE